MIQQIHTRFISVAAGVNKATHYSAPHLYRYVSRGLPRVARYVTPGRQKIYAEKQEYQLVCEAQATAMGIYSDPSRIAARNDSLGTVHPSFYPADRKIGDTGALKRHATAEKHRTLKTARGKRVVLREKCVCIGARNIRVTNVESIA